MVQSVYNPHATMRLCKKQGVAANNTVASLGVQPTYNACCRTISTMTTLMWDALLLAWVSFPPHARNSYVGLRLHRFSRGHAGRVEHSLHWTLPRLATDVARTAKLPGTANLSSGEVVAGSESGGVFVQGWLSVSRGIVGEMWELEEARLLWLALLLEIPRIHGGRVSTGWGR